MSEESKQSDRSTHSGVMGSWEESSSAQAADEDLSNKTKVVRMHQNRFRSLDRDDIDAREISPDTMQALIEQCQMQQARIDKDKRKIDKLSDMNDKLRVLLADDRRDYVV